MSVSELGPPGASVPVGRPPRRPSVQILDAVPAAPAPTTSIQDEAAVSLLGYWQTLLKHRIAIGAVFVTALVAGAVVTLVMPPVYTATATIQIDREPPKVMNVQQLDSPDLFSSEEFYQTQYGLLRSKSLALRMVRALGLDLNPAYLAGGRGLSTLLGGAPPPLKAITPGQRAAAQKRALRIFSHNLNVTPVRGSHLVKISYSNPNPLLAAQIANGTADNFITANLERRYEASSYARDFLQSRLAQVKQKLEDSEKQLAQYATQQRIINLPGPTQTGGNEVTQSPTANSLVSLNTALSEATAERIKSEQQWRQAQSASSDLPQVLQNPTIQSLTQARAGLQATYQDKLNLYRPNFPSMVQLHAQIAELDRQIAAETRSIRNSLQAQYQTSLNQERALTGRVEALKASMLDLNDRSIQYNILQREVDTKINI
jgi:succinoglycan biosynthesis transport protein ExoP